MNQCGDLTVNHWDKTAFNIRCNFPIICLLFFQRKKTLSNQRLSINDYYYNPVESQTPVVDTTCVRKISDRTLIFFEEMLQPISLPKPLLQTARNIVLDQKFSIEIIIESVFNVTAGGSNIVLMCANGVRTQC